MLGRLVETAAERDDAAIVGASSRQTGSLSRRIMLIAAGWISILLLVGGVALDRTLTGLVTRSFDEQLEYMLTAMVGAAEIGPDGEVFFNRPLGDQRFLEPNSGLYWQISGKGHEDYQEINGERHDFSDLTEAEKALAAWEAPHA